MPDIPDTLQAYLVCEDRVVVAVGTRQHLEPAAKDTPCAGRATLHEFVGIETKGLTKLLKYKCTACGHTRSWGVE